MNIKAIETKYKGYRFRSRLEARWAVFFDALGVKWEYEPEGFDLTDNYVEYLARLESENEECRNEEKRLRDAMLNRDFMALGQFWYTEMADKVRTRRGDYGDTDPFELTAFLETPVGIEEIWALPEEDWPGVYYEDVPELDTSLLLRYLPDFYLPTLDWWVEIKPFQSEQPWSDDLRHQVFPHRLVVIYGHPGVVKPYEMNTAYAATIINDSPYFFCECPSCGAFGFQYDGRSARNQHKANCSVPSHEDKNCNPNSPRILAAAHAAMSARFEHGETPRIYA